MRTGKTFKISDSKHKGKQIFLLALPYILTFAAIACFCFCGGIALRGAIENSPLSALFNAPELQDIQESEIDNITFDENTVSIDEFPALRWGDKWATMAVDELPDAKINGAPVYVGDTNEILKKGVGKYFGSRFCGEGGKIVLDAHCTREFYCLEDMQVGYTVRMHTVYGEYVYRVDDIIFFTNEDEHVVLDETAEEQLLLYTCYPRGITYRRQRIGIVCSKVSGVDFR